MTREEQFELWNSSVYRIGMNTSYNSSSTSTSITTLCTNPDKKTNTQWKVFSKDELDPFSQSSSDSDSDQSFDSDDDQTSDSDSDESSDPDIDNDLKLSPNPGADHQTYIDDYNTIKGSQIFVSHQSDFALQSRIARNFSTAQHSSSTNFRCVDPDCLDEFPSIMPIHAWYLHLELPKHCKFLDDHGQLACEFRYGRSFLDEWQRFIHYDSKACSIMDIS